MTCYKYYLTDVSVCNTQYFHFRKYCRQNKSRAFEVNTFLGPILCGTNVTSLLVTEYN